jgi:hypothetical protein
MGCAIAAAQFPSLADRAEAREKRDTRLISKAMAGTLACGAQPHRSQKHRDAMIHPSGAPYEHGGMCKLWKMPRTAFTQGNWLSICSSRPVISKFRALPIPFARGRSRGWMALLSQGPSKPEAGATRGF